MNLRKMPDDDMERLRFYQRERAREEARVREALDKDPDERSVEDWVWLSFARQGLGTSTKRY